MQPEFSVDGQAQTEDAQEETVTVSRVIDGDTIDLADGRRVRYIGIDTPEIGHRAGEADDCYGKEATERNRELVEGKEIRLVKDVSETDKYERILRYVYAGDVFVNETLVWEGYARAVAIKPDTKFYEQFKSVQAQAKMDKKGMWADDTCSVRESLAKNGFVDPLDRAGERVTKKPFGIHITPESSPVQPERFSGYHTGTDFEILAGEEEAKVEVRAICSGEIAEKRSVSGYGGVAVERCMYEGEPITVLYGHISLKSVSKSVGDALEAGEAFGALGDPEKGETDGERKHLHLGVHKGEEVDFRGYVSRKSNLKDWIDPCNLFQCNN